MTFMEYPDVQVLRMVSKFWLGAVHGAVNLRESDMFSLDVEPGTAATAFGPTARSLKVRWQIEKQQLKSPIYVGSEIGVLRWAVVRGYVHLARWFVKRVAKDETAGNTLLARAATTMLETVGISNSHLTAPRAGDLVLTVMVLSRGREKYDDAIYQPIKMVAELCSLAGTENLDMFGGKLPKPYFQMRLGEGIHGGVETRRQWDVRTEGIPDPGGHRLLFCTEFNPQSVIDDLDKHEESANSYKEHYTSSEWTGPVPQGVVLTTSPPVVTLEHALSVGGIAATFSSVPADTKDQQIAYRGRHGWATDIAKRIMLAAILSGRTELFLQAIDTVKSHMPPRWGWTWACSWESVEAAVFSGSSDMVDAVFREAGDKFTLASADEDARKEICASAVRSGSIDIYNKVKKQGLVLPNGPEHLARVLNQAPRPPRRDTSVLVRFWNDVVDAQKFIPKDSTDKRSDTMVSLLDPNIWAWIPENVAEEVFGWAATSFNFYAKGAYLAALQGLNIPALDLLERLQPNVTRELKHLRTGLTIKAE